MFRLNIIFVTTDFSFDQVSSEHFTNEWLALSLESIS